MALEFAELFRDFVPLGVGVENNAIAEESMLGELVAAGKTVLEVFRAHPLAGGLAANACGVDAIALDDFVSPSGALKRGVQACTYDVIVLSDVLAYVREPVRLLRKCSRLLGQGGFVVAVMPNFGYGAVRLAMLAGTYDDLTREQETNPRLHFFTFDVITSMLRRAGYRIEKTLRRSAPWESALRESRYEDFDETIVRQIRRDPEHATMTFVIKAAPAVVPVKASSPKEDAAAVLQIRLDAAEHELHAARTLNVELREAGRMLHAQLADFRQRARLTSQVQGELTSALQDLRDAFSMRDELVARIHSADAQLTKLARRGDLLEKQNADLVMRAQEAERSVDALRRQNAEYGKRAQGAEQTALALANELLQKAKSEVQELSELIDGAQRSAFWRLKRVLRPLGRLRSR